MKWEEVAKAAIIALLSISGGSYVTHSHDTAEQERLLNDSNLSCSEVIQLIINNKGEP